MDITNHILYQKILANYDAISEILDVFKRILEEHDIKLNTRRFRKLLNDSNTGETLFTREDKQQILTIATFFETFPAESVIEYIHLGKKEKIAREIMKCLDKKNTDTARVCYLLDLFHKIPAGKIHLPTTMTFGIRVNLISQFISSQLAYISISKNFINIRDVAYILDRVVTTEHSTGLIGGKAAGMILANRIVRPTLEPYDHDLDEFIEEVDSYYLKSSVITEFTTLNKLEECHSIKYFEGEEFEVERQKLYKRFMEGTFSENVIKQLKEILKKSKGTPLILRSSSFLEDSVGCSFTGKYDSFFISNRGTLTERLDELTCAIKKVYFSLYSASAIQYRKDRELLDYNERMSVLIQKVVGKQYGKYYLPAVAMVGFSRNAYCWNKKIKPEDGMLRMVMGLGTRAVDRVGDDYPRMVSLSAPALRPEVTTGEKIKYSQKYLDILNLETRQIETIHFVDLINELWENGHDFDIRDIISIDTNGVMSSPMFRPEKLEYNSCAITFDGMLKNSKFTSLIKHVFKKIEAAYNHPIDLEFAFDNNKLYILQCRTLSERTSLDNVNIPDVPELDVLFSSSNVTAGAIVEKINYIIYVNKDGYNNLNVEEKHTVARTIGKINKELSDERFILMGPGRWGSSNIELGIPVNYGDINHTLILIEMGWQKSGVAPELSYGTHFFQDLVEADIIPLPIFPEDPDSQFKLSFFTDAKNHYSNYASCPPELESIIKVIYIPYETNGEKLTVYLDGKHSIGKAIFQR